MASWSLLVPSGNRGFCGSSRTCDARSFLYSTVALP
jgi:hypothetical protein